MDQKLPYYMAYPMTLDYDDERIERMDFEYLKSMYPEIAKNVLPYVEEECDRMAYESSMIYDQYPDKLQLRMMCGRICENIKRIKNCSAVKAWQEFPPIRPWRQMAQGSGGSNALSGTVPAQERTKKNEA